MLPTVSDSTSEVENKLNQLRSILTAENLGLMTGVLSETDLKVISDIAGGGLSLKRSDSGLKSELSRLAGLNKGGITLDAIRAERERRKNAQPQ